ncbi:hypothetical protein E1B28_000001 [Marasmius oreades]|uniref:Uncharacterized protein n=1 Tax=Marasmius oreades TaxID=181124 RepID=A0A9P8AE61_9AGAR|nr:uncharacterized protein E1B28_000001 [Marasmius oreades]KAG7098025.1 hypothetical protein E1B28_000001 [Marasmius oreades]
MPSKSAFVVLVDAYITEDQAPWRWKPWQERTGVHHGLFPDDDRCLPPGWTRQNANDVHSFLESYRQIPKSQTKDREVFLKKSPHPGRVFFDKYITKGWDGWGIHDVVCDALRDECCHPFQLMLDNNSLKDFPEVDHYAPKVVDAIARKLFGHEAFPRGSSVLRISLTNLGLVKAFIVRSWVRLKKKCKSDQTRMARYKEEALAAFEDINFEDPTRDQLVKTITAIARWKALADIYSIDEYLEGLESSMEKLNELLADLGVNAPQPNQVSGRRAPKRQPKKSSSSKSPDHPTKSILASKGALNEVASYYQG